MKKVILYYGEKMEILLEDEINALFQSCKKNEMIIAENSKQFCRKEIETIMPQQRELLLLDEVSNLTIYDDKGELEGKVFLSDHLIFLEGHFPIKHIFPGVIQIETMMQLGMFFWSYKSGKKYVNLPIMQIYIARFINAIYPPGNVDIKAKIFEKKDTYYVIGQVRFNDVTSSVGVLELTKDTKGIL